MTTCPCPCTPALAPGVRDSLPEVTISGGKGGKAAQEKGVMGRAADKVKGMVGGGKEEL